MKQKTVIRLHIDTAHIGYSAYDVRRWTETIESENGTQTDIMKKRSEKLCALSESEPQKQKQQMTDYASAVILEMSKRLAYINLRKVYQKRGNDTMYSCLVQLGGMLYGREQEFPSWLADEIGTKERIQIEKKRTYKYATISERRQRVEIIPKIELAYTEFGKEYMQETEMHDRRDGYHFDANDLISEAYLTLCELYNANLLHSVSDIWNYREAVYHAINRYIDRQCQYDKASGTSFENMVELFVDAEHDNVLSGERAKQFMNKVDWTECVNAVLDVIRNGITSKTDAEKCVQAFVKVRLLGRTQADVASEIGVAQKNVSKWISYCDRVIQTAEAHEAIREIIFG